MIVGEGEMSRNRAGAGWPLGQLSGSVLALVLVLVIIMAQRLAD